jgi:alpha-glucosidase
MKGKNVMMTVRFALIGVTIAACTLIGAERQHATVKTVKSPDGRLAVTIDVVKGVPKYTLSWKGTTLIGWSSLGVAVKVDAGGDWHEMGCKRRELRDTWQPVWGKRTEIVDECNELTLSLEDASKPLTRLDIVFRAYDDGLAFRYVLQPEGGSQRILVDRDLSTFAFAVEGDAWSCNRENRPLGPEKLSASEGLRACPMTVKVGDLCTMAVLEAALYDFAWLSLESEANDRTFRARVAPCLVKTPFVTPWRVVMVGEKPGVLVDSDLLENLNPPCEIEDPSWIKTGVSFWDWRAWGHRAADFTYGLDLPSWKRFVDLGAEKGVPFLLLDADWYGPEFDKSSDPVRGDKAKDVREIIKYGMQRKVGILLYLNDAATRDFDLDTVLKTYHDWGAVGIKYGFMKGEGQNKVNRTRRIIELCARHKLTCDFHDGPVPPSGDTRTWPNCITREYCHSQSDAKRVFTPETFCLQVYVNMLGGPLDMCNGLFDMTHSLRQRPKIFEQLDSTIVAEAARTLISYSGLTVLPDSADMYREHGELFDYIAAQKQPWAESRTLSGEIGDYIVMARKTGETWLVAASTDDNARELNIPLDFLGKGAFEAVIFEDAPDAHWQTNREAYFVRKQRVKSSDVVIAKLAPGGGHCMLIRGR